MERRGERSTNYKKLYSVVFMCPFIHIAVCLTTGPKPLPKRALHIVRSSASSFRCEYPLLSSRSSSSFLRLLPRLPVTSIPPFIFPSKTCCRRQFLRKMWPIQLAFGLLVYYSEKAIYDLSKEAKSCLCLNKHDFLKTYWRSGGRPTAPLISNVSTTWS
jgi:hypothetical protein